MHRLAYWAWLAGWVLIGILLALLKPLPVYSDSDLTALVNESFLPRTETVELHDLAHRRAAEAAVNFSHDGMQTAEVLAWNVGVADPVAEVIAQWASSPDHLAVLMDPEFTDIGCGAVTTEDGRYVAACVLVRADTPAVTNEPESGPSASAPAEPGLLPDTAVPHGLPSR